MKMPEKHKRVPKRIAQTILNSLKGGVVPRIGLPYITVGRKDEIAALLHDVDIISEGGASFRFIVGRYGSGKSFLLQTMRNYVMDKGFIVVDGDLSPERRLHGNNGQGLATYRELIQNLSTKTRPEGVPLTWSLTGGSVQFKLRLLVSRRSHQTIRNFQLPLIGKFIKWSLRWTN